MSKYEYLKESLETTNAGKMKCGGNSMLPILSNPSICYYIKQDIYEIGDIVFCRVKGRYIDAHLITKKDNERYMISNNHNYDNGWTKTIYGKVIKAENSIGEIIYETKEKKAKDIKPTD